MNKHSVLGEYVGLLHHWEHWDSISNIRKRQKLQCLFYHGIYMISHFSTIKAKQAIHRRQIQYIKIKKNKIEKDMFGMGFWFWVEYDTKE